MQTLAKTQPQSRSVTVLGATGSIGKSTFDLLLTHQNSFNVVALTAQENVPALAEQAKALRARHAVIGNETRYAELKSALSGTGITAAAGSAAIIEAAQMPSDIVVAAIVGNAGLLPTLSAVKRGAVIALANKESLVCAGELFLQEVHRSGATLLPVDSEHSAIFQVFNPEQHRTIQKIILTASGGPFRQLSLEAMKHVTPEEAIKHPKWNMGAKISVDSATMMNKALECIEAYHLFPLTPSQIDVLIHPESIIHGLVYYHDGSVLSQMGTPDMRTPIAHALSWPERIPTSTPTLDLAALGKLTFEAPDLQRFPALVLGRSVLESGKSAPAILNAANEVAVARFLRKEIGFLDIVPIIDKTLDRIEHTSLGGVEDVLQIDRQSRAIAETI